jgi:glycosyltransferase involved in cell wall biosynthesis
MRICYLADAGSIHTQRWVKYFADSGHQVHLISYSPLEDNISGVTFHLLALPRPNIKILSASVSFIPHIVQIRKLVRELKPDILHAHYALGYGFFGAVTGFHPFLLSVWGSDVMVEPRQNAIFSLMVKVALAKADIVLTTSKYFKKYLNTRFNLPEPKVIALPWGVNPKIFYKDYKSESHKFKSNLGINIHDFVVSNPRHLNKHYGIQEIVQAVPYIIARYPKMILILIKGAADDAHFEKKINNLIERLGVNRNIRFISRHLNAEEMAVLYNISDAFVSIHKGDQFASTIQEGMACGSIPVVSNLEVYRQYLVDGINALFVDPDDPKDIAEKIIYSIEHPELKQKFYKINRKIIEENEDWFKNAPRLEELYQNLAEERSVHK